MNKKLNFALSAIKITIAIFSVFASQLVLIFPSNATTTATQQYSVTVAGGSNNSTRGGGYIWTIDNGSIKKISESTGNLLRTITPGGGITAQALSYSASTVFILMNDGSISYIQNNTVDTYVNLPSFVPCGNRGGGARYNSNDSITSDDTYVFVTCSVDNGTVGTTTSIHIYNTDSTYGISIELQHTTIAFNPLKAAIANGNVYIGNATSPYDVKKLSLSTYAASGSISSMTAISTTLDITNTGLTSSIRATSDGQNVWFISCNALANTYLITKINAATDAASTITLTGYTKNSYAIGGISSNQSVLFINFFDASAASVSYLVALNIADSTFSTVATYNQTLTWGTQAVSDGVWVSGRTAVIKFQYSLASAPAAPTINSVSGGDKSLTIAFTAGSNNGAAIDGYKYSLNGGSYVDAGTTSSPFIISGLAGRTVYSVSILAHNSVGDGAASSAVSGQTTDSARDAADSADAKWQKDQRDLTDLSKIVPELGKIALNLGETMKSFVGQKCIKGKVIKYVLSGSKCPKLYKKR